MKNAPRHPPARFGSLLGMAPGGVPVYSSDYASADEGELPNRHAYRSYVDGIFMGYKWQCVEFARRWMYLNKGYIFDDVAMAYDIFRLRAVRVVRDDSTLPLKSFRNGARRPPEPGCLLIWNEGGEFDVTGHVAVVTEVHPHGVRVVEQNVEQRVWPEGQHYSRELPAAVHSDGGYWIDCSFDDASILGWVIQSDDARHAEAIVDPDPRLFNLRAGEVADLGQAARPWLDPARPDEAAYIATMGGHRLSGRDSHQHRYLSLSETAFKELKRATNELHALFMHATDYVLQDDALLEQFNLPRSLWPRIHRSWDNRRNQMITGRFDFSVSERGIKLYEYNADSASCYLEAGKIQRRWAEHFGCAAGRCAGARLRAELVDAWRASAVDDCLHIMQDRDLEETYHALFMKEAMEEAGIRCKVLKGVAGLAWNERDEIVDPDGAVIKWVWKTWAWETALDQLRAQCDDDERCLDAAAPHRRHGAPRLVDVLLRPEVMVFEPLWTLIPSNKAILPVLWLLFPNHPYLLESRFALTDTLRERGHVVKPIAGRRGSNISVFDRHERLVEETHGKFSGQDHIYQELFPLPQIDGDNVQVCTFSVDGTFAGACVRMDPSLVITAGSDMLALRVVPDGEIAPAP